MPRKSRASRKNSRKVSQSSAKTYEMVNTEIGKEKDASTKKQSIQCSTEIRWDPDFDIDSDDDDDESLDPGLAEYIRQAQKVTGKVKKAVEKEILAAVGPEVLKLYELEMCKDDNGTKVKKGIESKDDKEEKEDNDIDINLNSNTSETKNCKKVETEEEEDIDMAINSNENSNANSTK